MLNSEFQGGIQLFSLFVMLFIVETYIIHSTNIHVIEITNTAGLVVDKLYPICEKENIVINKRRFLLNFCTKCNLMENSRMNK